jgi:ferredoxin--NADP+ reductase
VAARRGPADSAFTLPELIGLTGTAEVVLDAGDRALVERDLALATDPGVRARLRILAGLPDAETPAQRPRIRLAYLLTPHRITGEHRVGVVEFRRTDTGEPVALDAGLVLTSLGYRGAPIAGLPFDSSAAVVPNTAGRVIDPATARPVAGVYVAGWIKRGPNGFIGTNKSCSMQTVAALVDDFNAGLLADPVERPAALRRLVRDRRPEVVDAAGWHAIDAAEIARGVGAGRPRVKFTAVADMITAARDSATVTPWRKISRRAAVALRSVRER